MRYLTTLIPLMDEGSWNDSLNRSDQLMITNFNVKLCSLEEHLSMKVSRTHPENVPLIIKNRHYYQLPFK